MRMDVIRPYHMPSEELAHEAVLFARGLAFGLTISVSAWALLGATLLVLR